MLFAGYKHSLAPLLKHRERRRLPKGYKTNQYPLQTSTIDESSVSGNIAVINDVYINQLKMTHDDLSDIAVPCINDQSMNARIRGAKALRTADINPFTRIQTLQLGFSLFHLCMNLIWALLHVHCGSISQQGSLAYFFAVLDHSWLGCEHPDYHTLLSTLMQILQGIVLNAWKTECGYPSLSAFLVSDPSPEKLYEITDWILHNHGTPPHVQSKKKSNHQSFTPGSMSPPSTAIDDNNANRNLQILTQDLLYVLELTQAILDGDFG